MHLEPSGKPPFWPDRGFLHQAKRERFLLGSRMVMSIEMYRASSRRVLSAQIEGLKNLRAPTGGPAFEFPSARLFASFKESWF